MTTTNDQLDMNANRPCIGKVDSFHCICNSVYFRIILTKEYMGLD